MIAAGANRFRLTFWAMALYAFLSLGSQATMSIGIGLFVVTFVADGIRAKSLGAEWRALIADPWSRALTIAAVILSLVLLASLAWARHHPLTYAGSGVEVRFPRDLAKCWYLFIPLVWVMAWRRLTPAQHSRVLQIWLGTFAVLSAVGIQQFFTGWPRPQGIPDTAYFHSTLFIGHHLSVASIWIFPTFAAFDWIVRRADARWPVGRWQALAWFGMPAGALVLVLGYSRMLWVALTCGIALFLLIRLKAALRLPALVALGLLAYGATQIPQIHSRLNAHHGTGERQELWRINTTFFTERPLLGIGFGKTGDLTAHWYREKYPETYATKFVGHAHSLPLEILAGTGVLGYVAWLGWFGTIVASTLAAFRRRKTLPQNVFAAGLLCAWATLMLNSLTQVNFWEGKVLHQITFMAGLSLFWVARREAAARPE